LALSVSNLVSTCKVTITEHQTQLLPLVSM